MAKVYDKVWGGMVGRLVGGGGGSFSVLLCAKPMVLNSRVDERQTD